MGVGLLLVAAHNFFKNIRVRRKQAYSAMFANRDFSLTIVLFESNHKIRIISTTSAVTVGAALALARLD